MPAPIPDNEAERLEALRSFQILDTLPEQAFDDITKLASEICGAPISLVSLVDEARQWFKSRVGLSVDETHRDLAFCSHAILEPKLFVVNNAEQDVRFAANALVTSDPWIRFYAGAPLVTHDGYALGTLCVIDRVPRTLSEDKYAALEALGRQVVAQLELRKVMHQQQAIIAEQARLEAALREREEQFRSAIFAMQEGLLVVDGEGKIALTNSSANRLLQFANREIEGMALNEVFVNALREDESPLMAEDLPSSKALRVGGHVRGEIVGIQRAKGPTMWLSVNATPIISEETEMPKGVVLTFADIWERRWLEQQIQIQISAIGEVNVQLEEQTLALQKANRQLQYQSTTDGLTGLNNHRAFQERLNEELSRSRRYGSPLSLIMIDVDKFKEFNDAFGHPAGDEVLKRVASALTTSVRASDFAARYGGEEFAVILPNTDQEGALFFAERIRATVERLPNKFRRITASLGVVTLAPRVLSANQMVVEADEALYRSKQGGRNRVSVFISEHESEAA